ARFARFDDPSKALFEALKSDNIKKGLKEFKIADVTKDMFNPDSKEFKDIDIYDFTHYLLMANREPNENNPVLNRLIEAVKDMQKETKKGIKEVSKKTAEETEKEVKRDFSDTHLSNNEIKALLNNAKIPTSGRDAVIFGKNNLTPEIVEFLHKNNKRMAIEKASNKEIELLQNANFRHPEDVRASLDHEAITHILKRHGVNSVNVRNGENPITYQDIANYRDIVNNADEIIRAIGKGNKENITAFKQINGYAVVVEQAVNRNSELVLKTMFKSNGNYKNNNAYKKFSSTGLNANAKVQP
ncbi:PBECR3 domain-containing polyvalent protein, partial [Helicobacter pylori]